MPQAGDLERAQLRALYARLTAIAASGDARILAHVLDAAADLRDRARETLRHDLPADHSRPLAAFESACAALIESLRKTLPE